MTTRFQRARQILVRVILAAGLLALLGLLWFAPRAGRYLVVQNTLERSDVIVVLAGARVERWLEDVDLYRDGWAPRIVLSAGRIEDAEIRLHEMGIRFPGDAELARDAMVQMKIPPGAITILPYAVDNTAQEAEAVHELSTAAGWRRLIVVTSAYHTRRTSFTFSRELRGTPVRALVRATRYDLSTPDRWWTDRADFRFVSFELQRLLAYRLGLRG